MPSACTTASERGRTKGAGCFDAKSGPLERRLESGFERTDRFFGVLGDAVTALEGGGGGFCWPGGRASGYRGGSSVGGLLSGWANRLGGGLAGGWPN